MPTVIAEEPFGGQPLHRFLGTGGATRRHRQGAVLHADIHRSRINPGQISGQHIVVIDLAQVHRHEPRTAARPDRPGQNVADQSVEISERIETQHSNPPPRHTRCPPPWRAAKSLCATNFSARTDTAPATARPAGARGAAPDRHNDRCARTTLHHRAPRPAFTAPIVAS